MGSGGDRGEADSLETQLFKCFKGRDQCLMTGVAIRFNDDQGVILFSRLMLQRQAQGFAGVTLNGLAIQTVASVRMNLDDERFLLRWGRGLCVGFREVKLDPLVLGECRRHHEKNQKDDQDINEGDQVELGLIRLVGSEIHAGGS